MIVLTMSSKPAIYIKVLLVWEQQLPRSANSTQLNLA